MKRLALSLAHLLVLLLAAGPAAAQQVTRLVVPFAAGGVQDIIARIVAPDLAAALGRTVIVENRTGAGGTIGNAYVAKSGNDGNTWLLAAASHTITGHVYAKLPYHPIEDFTGLAHIGTVDYVLIVNAGLNVADVKSFIALGKANPGKFNYATAGSGSATHLSMAYFASLAGLEMVHIPFKATNEAVNEVLAGRAHAVISSTIGALGFTKDARVKMLGVTGATRSKFIPELPTLAESGLPGYRFDSWIGILAPSSTSAAAQEAVNAAMAKLLKDPAMLDKLDKQGVVPRALSVAQFNELLRTDYARMAGVVKAAGARID